MDSLIWVLSTKTCILFLSGITAGAGICAELGIPMTHRGVATSVRFLTGHSRAAGEVQLDESITAAADPHTTLIVYMGLKMLPQLTQQLTGKDSHRHKWALVHTKSSHLRPSECQDDDMDVTWCCLLQF